MKLYVMKCIEDPESLPEEGGSMLGRKEYFIKLETEEESIYYDENNDFWTGYMTAKLGIRLEDEDIYYYLFPDKIGLEVGETYEDTDGLVWERVE